MAGLITAEQLREEFPFVIQADISDARLLRSLATAARRLKSWVGEAVYNATGQLDEDHEQKLILQNAEGHLALHYALLGLNTNLRSFGVVRREQVEGNTVNEYFNPNDVETVSSLYLEKAQEIAEPFLLSGDAPTIEIVDGNIGTNYSNYSKNFQSLPDGIVPITRTINGFDLSENRILTQDDIGDGTIFKQFSQTEKTKLSGIAPGATANDSDANLKNRANHTGTQAQSTITNLVSDLAGKQASLGFTPENSANKNQVGGYAGLDGGGLIPSVLLPSFVDDVLEYANFAALPGSGETGKIYVTLNDNKTYRWSGSAYVEILASPGSTDSVTEGSVNLYFTAARVRETLLTGLGAGTNAAIDELDSIIEAFAKLQNQINNFSGGGMAIGEAVSGATAGRGLYADSLGKLADSANFKVSDTGDITVTNFYLLDSDARIRQNGGMEFTFNGKQMKLNANGHLQGMTASEFQILWGLTSGIRQVSSNRLGITAGWNGTTYDNSEGGLEIGTLYLNDGTIKQVTYGANDSGGSGYKVLRIPN